ncbi:MAG: sigma-54 dependent transcriptional regulator [Desulfobacteraceae bacterium]|jgi:DNA-binding NtrC family response regulator
MKNCQILFVDDDKDILAMVSQYLSMHGYQINTVDNGIDALGLVKETPVDIVFTDYKMPEFSGLELLAAIKKYKPETEVIIVTGYGSMESAIKAMKYGSYDYLQKPFKLEHLKLIIDRIIEEKKIKDKTKLIRKRTRERHKFDELIGISLKMQEIYELIETLSIDNPMVLLQGESGTGKELVARIIHKRSDRAKLPFILLNCGSIGAGFPEDQLDDHVKNLINSAKGGTLYLDEISEMAPSLRAKLMQSIKNMKKSGASKNNEAKPSARIIAATAKEIEDIIQSGALQGKGLIDLFNAVMIKMPPLRERKEDICLLINHFLHRIYAKHNKPVVAISPEAIDILLDYHWPGNLIQLQNVIERAIALGIEDMIRPEDLPAEIRTFNEVSKLS